MSASVTEQNGSEIQLCCLLHVSVILLLVFAFFLLLHSIPLYKCTIYLSILLLMDFWLISSCWLLGIKLQRTFSYILLLTHACCLSGKYLEVGLLGQRLGVYFVDTCSYHSTVSESGCTIFHCLQLCMRVPLAPQGHQHLILSFFFILAFLVCV